MIRHRLVTLLLVSLLCAVGSAEEPKTPAAEDRQKEATPTTEAGSDAAAEAAADPRSDPSSDPGSGEGAAEAAPATTAEAGPPAEVSSEVEAASTAEAASEGETASGADTVPAASQKPRPVGDSIDVYVVPITEGISKPNLYILRRGLKEAIANEVDMVLLDMDTPGGRVDVTIEMMEMLSKFEGITATFVNPDAISAGSFIAAATEEIYFAPQGKMGASAVIQGGGQEVPETARLKVESYLRANIRVLTEDYPYRSDVIRAMLDADFELKIGDEVIKPAGELLTLTAREAARTYGEPPQPLLSSGTFESVEELLDARLGAGAYTIRDFDLTYSEVIAKWMNTFAPALLGIGLLMLFFEFRTPGFGIFGIAGIAMLGVFFISQYIAGLAGNEPVLFFALGVVLVVLEIFLFPGTFIFAVSGIALILGSLLWAMVDVWPQEPLEISPELIAEPLVNLVFGLSVAFAGSLLLMRFFPGSWVERSFVLASRVGGHSGSGGDGAPPAAQAAPRFPPVGSEGTAVTDLYPSGRVEIDGLRYEARSALGPIEHGSRIRVQRTADFGVVVEEIPTKGGASGPFEKGGLP